LLIGVKPTRCRCLVNWARSIAILLVRLNDELAQELVAKAVKVVTVELCRLLALEVGLCEWC
jgi:hypothetical protein